MYNLHHDIIYLSACYAMQVSWLLFIVTTQHLEEAWTVTTCLHSLLQHGRE